MSELLKDLKMERVQGSSAVLNYSNFDYWVNWDDIVEIVEKHKQPILNENQQIVLDYLKNTFVKSDNAPIVNFSAFGWKHFGAELPTDVEEAYKQMNGPQDLQVLAAFAEWEMKHE